MGVTIHYQGRAADGDAVTEILRIAQMFAAAREWPFPLFENPFDIGVDDAEITEEEERLPYQGIVIRPLPDSEPFRLQFDTAPTLCAFTKTQFAPFSIHIEIVRHLREIEPHMEQLLVVDECGLWESGDASAAHERFQSLGEIIDILASEPERTEGGDLYWDTPDADTWRNN